MKYIIETTENGVNETLEVDGNLYKKEWCREENGIFRCKQKNFADQMENDGYDNELYYLKKSMRFLIASLPVL